MKKTINKIEPLTSKKTRSGYRFYWNGKDITLIWMNFFASLSPDEEPKCIELFNNYVKKHGL